MQVTPTDPKQSHIPQGGAAGADASCRRLFSPGTGCSHAYPDLPHSESAEAGSTDAPPGHSPKDRGAGLGQQGLSPAQAPAAARMTGRQDKVPPPARRSPPQPSTPGEWSESSWSGTRGPSLGGPVPWPHPPVLTTQDRTGILSPHREEGGSETVRALDHRVTQPAAAAAAQPQRPLQAQSPPTAVCCAARGGARWAPGSEPVRWAMPSAPVAPVHWKGTRIGPAMELPVRRPGRGVGAGRGGRGAGAGTPSSAPSTSTGGRRPTCLLWKVNPKFKT